MKHFKHAAIVLLALTSVNAFAEQNTQVTSFSKSKKLLMANIYNTPERQTIYCQAGFTDDLKFIAPAGFESKKYPKRQTKIEFEHLVPAENFGRAIAPTAWNEGHPACVTKSGKEYKGRRCASKASDEFRRAESDMHNLYAANGAVNALRSNHNFVMMESGKSSFGSCDMQIDGNKVQPPEYARGVIARAYMYMEDSYPRYSMSKSQRKLMNAWDKMHPATQEECSRYKIIDRIQGGKNQILQSRCAK